MLFAVEARAYRHEVPAGTRCRPHRLTSTDPLPGARDVGLAPLAVIGIITFVGATRQVGLALRRDEHNGHVRLFTTAGLQPVDALVERKVT